ncbi:acyl-CoA dehydrogenase (plasmid) [Streptomyces sp. NBC_00868]|uniref:acyl-CoA dehydrogenase family protein n=1 Tax=Streptomyces sp. NBC_00868 TaxID=2903683 RepID=UPI002F91B78D|nr:acyl-CoA dehydrogenase [Streptomyces sp. NBC_00868]
MTELLDRRLRTLQQYVRAEAPALRTAAQETDAHPDGSTLYPQVPLLDRLATLQIPRPYAPDPLILDGEQYYLLSAMERVVFHEEAAAHGDASLLLCAPGSLTAGMLVASLGDEAQQRNFFTPLQSSPTWTFLAMTEPQGGSDATTLRTTLEPSPDGDGYLLTGTKRFIGNAHRARTGVVTVRTAPGPLGIRCAIVDTSAPGFTASPLATLGMRGALGALTFDQVHIPAENLLGSHLPPTRRGMWGWLHSFNLLRCVAAAMAVGLARATHDYLADHIPPARLAPLAARIHRVQALTHAAARAVDADPTTAHLPAAAKTAAATLAEDITTQALSLLGTGARLEHPLLDKWTRDAHGFDPMEGTAHIQALTIFPSLNR